MKPNRSNFREVFNSSGNSHTPFIFSVKKKGEIIIKITHIEKNKALRSPGGASLNKGHMKSPWPDCTDFHQFSTNLPIEQSEYSVSAYLCCQTLGMTQMVTSRLSSPPEMFIIFRKVKSFPDKSSNLR